MYKKYHKILKLARVDGTKCQYIVIYNDYVKKKGLAFCD